MQHPSLASAALRTLTDVDTSPLEKKRVMITTGTGQMFAAENVTGPRHQEQNETFPSSLSSDCPRLSRSACKYMRRSHTKCRKRACAQGSGLGL
eukprot:scaffold113375_cov60-Phaeocystis_antarctica.AAC.2